MKAFLSRFIPALAVLAIASPALAQTTSTLLINTTVSKACKTEVLATQTAVIAYDVYTPVGGANGIGTATFNVQCSKNVLVRVAADKGANGAYGTSQRSVKSAATGASIGYVLTANGTAELPWDTAAGVNYGQGMATVTTVIGNGKVTRPVTFTATLEAADVEPATDYNDSVAITFSPDPT